MTPSTHAPKKISNEELSHFCVAIRGKQDWQTKIMNDKIALKWAIEAELLLGESEILKGEALEAINELRRSILTIHTLDQDINLLGVNGRLEQPNITTIDSDFQNALKYARGSEYGIHEPELKETGLGVFISDGLVPLSVHQELVHELDILAAREPRDYHPGSFGKVQDLIHPSLYPYIAGVTPTAADVTLPPIVEGKFRTELSDNNDYNQKMSSSYAWIPSVFKVSPDGTDVHIDSYINGLGNRDEHPGLFRVIEKMFLLALPHFEKTIQHSKVYEPRWSTSVARWETRQIFLSENRDSLIGYCSCTREKWNEFLADYKEKWDSERLEEQQEKERLREDIRQEKSNKESFFSLGEEFVASDIYKGEELKVIVKAANYTLAAGREYEGSWHLEGMPHERIIASVIYYYDTDNAIEDEGLSFRKFRDISADFPAIEDSEYTHEDFSIVFPGKTDYEDEEEDHYPSDWETELDDDGNLRPVSTTELSMFIEMGNVPTTNFGSDTSSGTGRMLSFPNWLQHRVVSVRNTSTSGESVATRKILCFFLVDDSPKRQRIHYYPGFSYRGLRNMNVLTTSEVPDQMRKCNEATLLTLLPLVSTKLIGTPLPPELVVVIWEYISFGTMSREDAEKHRLALMEDRKMKSDMSWNTYSLCEH